MVENYGLDEIIDLMNRRKKKQKTEAQYVDLQTNERTLATSASAIYAAYIAAGKVTDGEEERYIMKSIAEALKIAVRIEDAVSDVEEQK